MAVIRETGNGRPFAKTARLTQLRPWMLPRCRAGLEHLAPSAQLMVAGPSLLIGTNLGTLELGALADR
jgi:hypothetical protein